jgi:glutamate synthase domain-containing protein 2/glutamate synthase domain-containing protein 1/glutamate synthase domain-containing protein 3
MTSAPLTPLEAPLYDPRRDHDACGVGFVADLHGRHRSRTVAMALEALDALEHRGARAADDATGDGAGISIPLSRRLLRRIAAEAGVSLDTGASVAVGMCFLPPRSAAIEAAVRLVAEEVAAAGLALLGWRRVPTNGDVLGRRRIGGTPEIRQVLVGAPRRIRALAFARRLALARRAAEQRAARTPGLEELAVVSLSPRTVVYKGLFVGAELGRFYADLTADDLDARYALFHQRYSTNTFPSWRLAQPFGYLAHNGEINTIRANREAMRGRRHALGGGAWARRLAEAGPLVSTDASDSASLDEALELLLLAGWPIDAAARELIPAAPGLGGGDESPAAARIEPWDGPAAIAFADGRRVGCMVDRNGLRPLALTVTDDGLVAAASEAGAIALPEERVVARHRLGPGEMAVVDLRARRLIGPEVAAAHRSVPAEAAPARIGPSVEALAVTRSDDRTRVSMGLDAEIVRQVIRPMALEGKEAIWSMGDDTPIAPLARRHRRVTAFLRQSFAQVTNPAIDPERERAVMSLGLAVGRQAALLGRGALRGDSAVTNPAPVLDAAGWNALLAAFEVGRVVTLDATWRAADGQRGLSRALERLARRARGASRRGVRLIVVSDNAAGPERVAMPPVLAVGRVHQALLEMGRRPETDVAVECGECFDVHDVAMLLAVGASAIHPWLLLELTGEVAGGRGAEELDADAARANVRAALEHGLRKVLARMGISTLASYRGGQLFDAIGLATEFVESCFPATAGWPGRVDAEEIGATILERHRRAFGGSAAPSLEDPGLVRFRGQGESHAFAPKSVKALQAIADAAPSERDLALQAYRDLLADPLPRQPRDLVQPTPLGPEIPTARVEPAKRILRRFVSSAMSLGALSPEAHQALSIGMARIGAASNSGEGGEDPAWYAPSESGDRRDAAIKQVASARFGVTAEYLARAEQLEIKIAQGSKPGEGGQLPGRKATAFIAGLRRGKPGMTMISPPPHHDIYSIEDLAQLISDLRAINPTARIGVKLVAGAGIGTIAAGVAKAHADYILVSGHAGGTGASPLSSIKHAGMPWELGLAEVHQVLVRNRLRDRVTLRTDGGLQTGRDVVIAAMLGAEEFGFGTAALVALGCDMARQCHLDTCPTGIATQREDLRAKFTGQPEQVVSFFTALAQDVRRELAALGMTHLGQAVGRADLLRLVPDARLDLERVVRAPAWRPPARRLRVPPRDQPLVSRVTPAAGALVEDVGAIVAAVDAGRRFVVASQVSTRDRAVGARLAGALSRRPEPRRLPHVTYRLTGSAGQSLGAFGVAGMRIEVTGEANDYVGKGLSGATVIVRPSRPELAASQAVAGNVCLFGATAGVLHVIGRAGMRFAVRNSGARAVVEGIGAHGCEYMTGGTIVVLGEIGANFGAGMTGGRAYIYDADAAAESRLNAQSVAGRPLIDDADERPLLELLAAQASEGSTLAAAILADWPRSRTAFIVVEPREEAPAVSLEARQPERLAVAR